MKISIDSGASGHVINAYSDEHIVVSGSRYNSSLIVLPDQIIVDWPVSTFEQLGADSFAMLAELAPDIVILGTGRVQRFPRPETYKSLIQAHIGLEVMTTSAACRTYNILMSEDRRVAAALILD
jgi:uncharacterized protein